MTKLKGYVATMVLLASTPALAGEITGNGDPTPIKSRGVASSECSFSGRNDDASGGNSHVQAYGMIVRAFGQPYPGVPGDSCRGNLI